MKDEAEILDYYRTDKYFENNSVNLSGSLGEGEKWKVNLAIPQVAQAVTLLCKKKVSILDVGGGTGLCLNSIVGYARKNFEVEVDKYSIDLSPRFSEIQRRNNPDLVDSVVGDIRSTSFSDLISAKPQPRKLEAWRKSGSAQGLQPIIA